MVNIDHLALKSAALGLRVGGPNHPLQKKF